MNEAFAVRRTFLAGGDRFAVQIQFHDVCGGNLRGRNGSRDQVAGGSGCSADTDVTECIDNLLLGKNVVGRDDIFDQSFEGGSLRGKSPPYKQGGAAEQKLTPCVGIHA